MDTIRNDKYFINKLNNSKWSTHVQSAKITGSRLCFVKTTAKKNSEN